MILERKVLGVESRRYRGRWSRGDGLLAGIEQILAVKMPRSMLF
jgi:hypothetical protein